MELAAAERAAIEGGREIARAVLEMADVEKPRDPAEKWEHFIKFQFQALTRFSRNHNYLKKPSDLPPRLPGCRPGMEVNVFLEPNTNRVWKTTLPNLAGFGPSGYFTPADYLRRLRLSNLIFGDDVRFEGVLQQKEGPSIVTSQRYILPHPERFIPTEEEIACSLEKLGFYQRGSTLWIREEDGISLGDCHDRNFMRTPGETIVAIDVQPILQEGHDWENVIPWTKPS